MIALYRNAYLCVMVLTQRDVIDPRPNIDNAVRVSPTIFLITNIDSFRIDVERRLQGVFSIVPTRIIRLLCDLLNGISVEKDVFLGNAGLYKNFIVGKLSSTNLRASKAVYFI